MGEGWDRWLCKLELFSISEKEIVLNAPDKFVRDWIIREFIDRSFIENGNTKNLKTVVQEICPNIEKVLIICVMPI